MSGRHSSDLSVGQASPAGKWELQASENPAYIHLDAGPMNMKRIS